MPDRLVRVALAVLVFNGVLVGGWAAFAPRSFYDDFPGFGRHWIAVDGPYNEHLVRDVGALNLALAALAVCALVWMTRPMVTAAALAGLAYGVPHVVYHARHLEAFEGADAVALVVGVASTALAGALLAAAGRPAVGKEGWEGG